LRQHRADRQGHGEHAGQDQADGAGKFHFGGLRGQKAQARPDARPAKVNYS
jgi:hypothetical protein